MRIEIGKDYIKLLDSGDTVIDEYWVTRIKCWLDNPELPFDFVKELLISKETDCNLAEPFEEDV